MNLICHSGRPACRGVSRRGACLCLAAAMLAGMGAGAGAEDAPDAVAGRHIRESGGELAARVRTPREPSIPLPLLPHITDRQERAAQVSVFHVDVVESPLTAEIAGSPGEYPVAPVLALHVVSSAPGWQIKIKALDLRHTDPPHGDKIGADEVIWTRPDGARVPLRDPALVVAGGPAGEGVIEAPLLLVTREFHRPGEYEGWIEIISSKANGANPRTIKVPIGVVVSAHASLTIRDNMVYFHFGQLPAANSALVQGEIHSDVPVHLTISAVSDRVDRLPLVKAFGNADPDTAGTIELDWRLGEGALGTPRPPDCRTNDGSSFSWLLAGTPGELAYRLQVGAKPVAHQAPGDYGMEVVVTLQPCL